MSRTAPVAVSHQILRGEETQLGLSLALLQLVRAGLVNHSLPRSSPRSSRTRTSSATFGLIGSKVSNSTSGFPGDGWPLSTKVNSISTRLRLGEESRLSRLSRLVTSGDRKSTRLN